MTRDTAAGAIGEATEDTDEEAKDEAPKPVKRQTRTGLGNRWCDALNTEAPEENQDGTPGVLSNPQLVDRLLSTVDAIEKSPHQEQRRERMRRDLELLHGERIEDLDSATCVIGIDEDTTLGDQIFHASYSVLSTIKNRIISFRPRAQFLPNQGNGKARRAARNMTALSDAWADAVDFHGAATMAYDDKLGCDLGVLKFYVEDGLTDVMRVPPWEILVDQKDGRLMRQECTYHVRHLPAAQVAAHMGVELAEIVDGDGFETKPGAFGQNGGREEAQIRVIDCWQNASGKRNGRHVVVVGKRLEVDEDWEYDEPPLLFGRFDKKRIGFEGSSAMSKLRAAQEELNDQQVTLREAHYNSATKMITYNEGETAPTGFNNDYVNLIPVPAGGAPPTIQVPPPINAGYYNYLQTIKDQMRETIGINEGAQTGMPSQKGATSAVAIRESTELQTDRLAEESQEWEKWRVDGAKWWWRLTRDYARLHPEAKPKWRALSRGAWREMIFDDIEGEYQIERFPSSLFGQSLPGRFQRATDLIKEGWIEREDAMAALDVPDISPVVDLALAEKYIMEKIVDDIVEDEHYETPDEYIRPEKLFGYARSRYFLLLVDGGATPKAMNLMRRLLNEMKPKDAPAIPAPAAGAAPPPMPGAPVPITPPPPVLPGIAPPTSAGPTTIGEPPMAPPPLGLPPGGLFPPSGLPPVQPVTPVMQ